jgi:serine-type D-Ala-D-Ala carboxypeptidase (penicillin-binding protein 5/6)
MTRRILAIVGLVLALGVTAAVAIAIWPSRTGTGDTTPTSSTQTRTAISREVGGPGKGALPGEGSTDAPTTLRAQRAGDVHFALQPVSGALPVHHPFKHPPAAGILFDVKSGEVLWQRRPRMEHAIASLTKMMTALMVVRDDPPEERVRISRNAAHTAGSATGLLPGGRKVPLEPLLQALIMISANDAAVALAEHDAGNVPRFVKAMNRQARSMGLQCTHFSTPNGLRDRGNYSCPVDLAELARADLANPRIAEIAATSYAKPRFPIKGKHLYLSNNHYFLQHGLAGLPQAQVTGLKTGFTDASGSCYVTTARVGRRQLGLVLLDTPNPILQVPALLRAGFEEIGAVPKAPPPPPSPPKGNAGQPPGA